MINRRCNWTAAITAVLVGLCLVCAASAAQPKREGQIRDEEEAPPACGQSKVLGKADKIYDTSDKCTEGRTDLKNAAKDDAIIQCNSYCAFLSSKCEMKPALTRDNLTAGDPNCNKKQDDGKVHARALSEATCVCKAKP